jgi:uncharacterized protein YciI
MYVVFLKFTPLRTQAATSMAAHTAWLRRHIDAGTILLAGSLDSGQGGALIMAPMERHALDACIAEDPFVAQGIVQPEVHAIQPSAMAAGFASLLGAAA